MLILERALIQSLYTAEHLIVAKNNLTKSEF